MYRDGEEMEGTSTRAEVLESPKESDHISDRSSREEEGRHPYCSELPGHLSLSMSSALAACIVFRHVPWGPSSRPTVHYKWDDVSWGLDVQDRCVLGYSSRDGTWDGQFHVSPLLGHRSTQIFA